MTRARPFLVSLLALALLPSAAPAQSGFRMWFPEDRQIVGDFTRITSVAVSSQGVVVTSPSALLIWRSQFRRWEGPFIPPEPGTLDRVFAALVDPLDNSVWFARTDGWAHYQPDFRLWSRGALDGTVQEIAFDMADPAAGLFIRTEAGWVVLPRGAPIAMPGRSPSRPVRPATLQEALRDNPSIQANAAPSLLTPSFQNAHYTAVARAFGGRGWYLGTAGAGLLYWSDGAPLPERLPFGLPGNVVSAVYPAPGGVWVATDRTTTSESGLTFVASDLTEFMPVGGYPALSLRFNRARGLVGMGPQLWMASDIGVLRIPTDGRPMTVFNEGRGLPDARTISITTRKGEIGAGTVRGVVRIAESNEVYRVAREFVEPALAVALDGDTVWIGSRFGLFSSVPGDERVTRAAGQEDAGYHVPVVGITWIADTLIALTENELVWRDPKAGAWTRGPNLSSLLGPLHSFAPDLDGFWVAGTRSVAFVRLGSPPIRPLAQPGDLPGEPLDLAADPTHLWVGTTEGLVRFSLRAIRP